MQEKGFSWIDFSFAIDFKFISSWINCIARMKKMSKLKYMDSCQCLSFISSIFVLLSWHVTFQRLVGENVRCSVETNNFEWCDNWWALKMHHKNKMRHKNTINCRIQLVLIYWRYYWKSATALILFAIHCFQYVQSCQMNVVWPFL